MDDKLSIRINIAERFYPLRIESDEEEKVRLAAKTISDKLQSLKQKQPTRDVQDWLAMVCLWFAMKLVDRDKNQAADSQEMDVAVQGIRELEQQIAEYVGYADTQKIE
jgi:cell division protein ZapA